jgi:hypothetical protein
MSYMCAQLVPAHALTMLVLLHACPLLFTANDSNFAECPLFEPYAPKQQQLQHRRSTAAHNTTATTAADVSSAVLQERGLQESTEPLHCWRLPSRYNGDWPLLFVDGAIQRTQHSLDSNAPADWVRLKKVKVSELLSACLHSVSST